MAMADTSTSHGRLLRSTITHTPTNRDGGWGGGSSQPHRKHRPIPQGADWDKYRTSQPGGSGSVAGRVQYVTWDGHSDTVTWPPQRSSHRATLLFRPAEAHTFAG